MGKTCNLVLDGGGVKGIALVGAIKALEEAGYDFRRVAGTSAGAVVGGLLAAGYSGSELHDVMHEVPYEKFRDEGLLSRVWWPGKLASLYFTKGIYQGDFFCRWYEDKLAQRGASMFGDIQFEEKYRDEQPYPFVALATNISRGTLLHFPRDLNEYDIAPQEQSIAGAVRASISLPVFYQPVRLGGDYLVDGGILSSFPYHCFAGDDIPTIGIKLSARPEATGRTYEISGAFSYGEAVLRTMLNAQERAHMNDEEVIENTIFVETGTVMSTDFDLTWEQQSDLYQAGYQAAGKFLDKRS